MWIRESALLPPLGRLSADFGEESLRAAIDRSNDEPIPAALTLSVLVPDSPAAARDADLARLFREIASVAKRIDRDREVAELIVDASAMTVPLRTFPWAELLSAIEHQFYVAPRSARTVLVRDESSPIGPADAAALKAAGFDSLALATGPARLCAVDVAHRCGFSSVSVRLQAEHSGSLPPAALAATRETRPERLEIVGIDAWVPTALAPEGYAFIGPGQYALDGDELALAAKSGRLRFGVFGYTAARDSDVVGVGPAAISQVGDCVTRNAASLETWRAAIDGGRLAAAQGILLDVEDRLRNGVMQALLCRRKIPAQALEAAFDLEFRRHFAAELARLRALPAGRYLRDTGEYIEVDSPGWPWLRTMARCFARHENRPSH